MALRTGLRGVERRHGDRGVAHPADPVRAVTIGAGRDARLTFGHGSAVGARQILGELVDAHLRIELPHVRRIAVAFGTHRRDRRCATRRRRDPRSVPLVARWTLQSPAPGGCHLESLLGFGRPDPGPEVVRSRIRTQADGDMPTTGGTMAPRSLLPASASPVSTSMNKNAAAPAQRTTAWAPALAAQNGTAAPARHRPRAGEHDELALDAQHRARAHTSTPGTSRGNTTRAGSRQGAGANGSAFAELPWIECRQPREKRQRHRPAKQLAQHEMRDERETRKRPARAPASASTRAARSSREPGRAADARDSTVAIIGRIATCMPKSRVSRAGDVRAAASEPDHEFADERHSGAIRCRRVWRRTPAGSTAADSR